MGLGQLPPELKLIILENLDPLSGLHFATTCWTNWTLCKKFLHHQKNLAGKYRCVKAGDENHTSWTVQQFHDRVLDDPDIAFHVKEIQISVGKPYVGQTNAHHYPHFDRHPTVVNPSRQALPFRIVAAEKPSQVAHFVSAFLDWVATDPNVTASSGSDDRCQGLKAQLSNIKVFRCVYPVFDLRLEYGPKQESLANRDRGDSEVDPEPFPPSQHLTSVFLTPKFRHTVEAGVVVHFMAVTSVQKIVARHVSGMYVDQICGEKWLSAKPMTSNVTVLTFRNSILSHRSLDHVLALTSKLKEFHYSSGLLQLSNVSPQSTHKEMIKSLLKHCATSIEHITLVTSDRANMYKCDEDYSALESLQGFQNLKTLQCMMEDLVSDRREKADVKSKGHGQKTETEVSFSKLFPPSLKSLHCSGTINLIAVNAMLKSRRHCLPNLTQFYFCQPPKRFDCMWNIIEKRLEHSGFRYMPLPRIEDFADV